jgi:maltose alpha-D-glucosyltransferase/alpha-amylase
MYRVYAQDPQMRINLGIRRRLAPLLGNHRRRIELMNGLLFSLPGTPIIYYGDEIGMGDNFYLGDRNGVRTPMQWTADRNAGFSRANPQQLYLPTIIDPEYHYESVNVENQQKNVSSLFWWMRRLLAVRQRFSAFARGTIEFVQPDNAKVLAYVRRHESEAVLVVANLSRFVQVAELDLSAYAGQVPEELFGHSSFPEIKLTPAVFTLSPHGFYWLLLRPPTAAKVGEAAWTAPQLAGVGAWSNPMFSRLERDILPGYVPTCRWFGGKGRVVRELKIAQNIAIGSLSEARLLVIEIAFTDGLPESYVLPLIFVDESAGQAVSSETPHAILARFDGRRVLCDAIHVPEVRAEILRLIMRRSPGRARVRLAGSSRDPLEDVVLERALVNSRVVGADQSNTSVIYGDMWFLKLFRKFEHGPNPDMEVTQFLSEVRGFPHVPPYVGALRLVEPAGEGVVALLTGFTPNQGDAWTFTLDAVARYFERVLESRAEPSAAALLEKIGGVYPERARQLGQRTAEMHLALASGEDRPEFAAEAFSTLYQRSLYQAMRGSAGRVLQQLRRQASRLPEALRTEAAEVAASQSRIYASFAQLTSRKIAALKIRTHGDYHLGQVLNTGKDFVILDFEGEPRLALGERLLKRSPLRDVAGMVRSFDYAGSAALRLQNPTDAARLEPWARGWVDAVSRHFLESYFATAAGATFLPPDAADVALLLKVFTLDKAIYEVGYELSYRPEFLPIPLGAVGRLIVENGTA